MSGDWRVGSQNKWTLGGLVDWEARRVLHATLIPLMSGEDRSLRDWNGQIPASSGNTCTRG